MGSPPTDDRWDRIAAERRRLAEDLATLPDGRWSAPTWCERWSVEQVVAHLTAGATTGRWAWLRSMAAARFDPAVHNQRRLAEHLGPTPGHTLDRFRAAIDSRTAPTGDLWAWLGEIVVHAANIREPLGLATRPPVEAVVPVAIGYAGRDFAVNSRRAIRGVRLVATDSDFSAGRGPVAQGTTLDLVLAMAGRGPAVARLTGDGTAVLRSNLSGSR